MRIKEFIIEATGDRKFDRMMKGTTELLTSIMSPRDPYKEMTPGEERYFEQLHGYVDRFMDRFVAKMDSLGIEFIADRRPNPPPEPARPGNRATQADWKRYHQAYADHVKDTEANWDFNPKFRRAYEQAALPAVRAFIKGLKLDPNNSELLDRVKQDFDHAADQYDRVAGFTGDFMKDFTMFRPGELDVLSKSGALKDTGNDVKEAQDWQGNRGAGQSQTTDHTMDEAIEYVKSNYPFAKKYRVRRAEPGFRAGTITGGGLVEPRPGEFDRQLRTSQQHVKGVDAAMDYLQLQENPVMSGSKQISSSLGYSWHTNENRSNGIAVMYYEDRGMGWDEIIVAAKDKNNLKSAVQVFRDAGVIPTPKTRATK